MKLLKPVVSLLLLSCLAAAGAVGRKISDYTETLSPQDGWLYEIAVPGVTNYKVTFGTIVTGVVARVPAGGGTGEVSTAQLNTASNFLYTTETTRNAAVSNAVVSLLVTTSNSAIANLNGKGTNTTWYGATLPGITASRPLYLNASGNVTNASGTPDGTKFMRDDGVLVVPGGAGDVTTAQLNTSSNAIVSFETTRNAAVSNALVSMLGTGLTNLSVYITFKTYGDAFVSSNLWVTQMITAARTDVVDANFSNIVLTNALGSNQVRLGRQDLTNYSYNPLVISGVGGANTNFTLQAGQPEVIINAFTNVSLRGVMGGSATKIDYIRVTMTNGSGTDRTVEFSPATNSFRFSSTVGTNAPSVITNMTQLHATFRVSHTNVLVKADYYPWP